MRHIPTAQYAFDVWKHVAPIVRFKMVLRWSDVSIEMGVLWGLNKEG